MAASDLHPIVQRLLGSNRRSIGQANDVAGEIATDARLFAIVFEAMLSVDPVLRMRAADAVEKATRRDAALLQPYKQRLLQQVAHVQQAEVRWHVAQLLPRLALDGPERAQACALLEAYLQDPSTIVRVNALQALADLAATDPVLRRRLLPLVAHLTESDRAAVRARSRRVLATLTAQDAASDRPAGDT